MIKVYSLFKKKSIEMYTIIFFKNNLNILI